METSKNIRVLSMVLAAVFSLAAMIGAYRTIGMAPVVIVGGSSVIGFLLWTRTYLRRPLPPEVILPPFLLTVAALELHMAEEYLSGFGPAMSRVFDISWTERSFLIFFAFVGPSLYALTALGLYKRVPLAGFMACFLFIGPGVAELTHFIFPLLMPAIAPDDPATISQAVSNGRFVADMPNYWFRTTATYYFPGLYTAVLPMIPGIWAIVRAVRGARRAREAAPAAAL
ncbi:MAG: hypothetical protein R3F14_26710 [Polyangiaceae bacterium]